MYFQKGLFFSKNSFAFFFFVSSKRFYSLCFGIKTHLSQPLNAKAHLILGIMPDYIVTKILCCKQLLNYFSKFQCNFVVRPTILEIFSYLQEISDEDLLRN